MNQMPFNQPQLEQLKALKQELTRFMMSYKFGLEEIQTKIEILKQEFELVHEYNPIEHVKSRLKNPESILKKVQRRGYDWTIDSIRDNVRDIAGIRINCSFVSDIYKVSDMLQKQKDITVVEFKDYIAAPKPNGYQSLHMILQIPVFMSDRTEDVYVEVQIRTIAMDFWASLEHKIYYKYDKDVPQHLKDGLKEAAETITALDRKMEQIHQEMQQVKNSCPATEDDLQELLLSGDRMSLPVDFLTRLFNRETS